jgi:hypothetical protein
LPQLSWVEPRAQLLFHVSGDKGEAMVTAEVVKHRGGVVFNLLALDLPATASRPAEVLLLQGDRSKLEVRGTLRGFLQQTQQMQFASIPQNRDAPADGTLVSEQESLPTEEDQLTQEAAEAELTEEELIRRKQADMRPGRSY